jgi:predicted AAA+ superfamily ATPase
MDREEYFRTGLDLKSLVIFRNLKKDKIISSIIRLFTEDTDLVEKTDCLSEAAAAIYENGGDLTEYIKKLVFEDENLVAVRSGLDSGFIENEENRIAAERLDRELIILEKLAAFRGEEIAKDFGLPPIEWKTSEADLVRAYHKRISEIEKYGYGIFAKYYVFHLDKEGGIIPVKYPDPISTDDLIGYETERKKVMDNTGALVAGKPAANVLLTGAAGTGKSTTVKAAANAFFDKGLRIIELKKEQIVLIPRLMDRLCTNPLKFIIFIDDLTFNEDESNFSTMKAILEGSVSARAHNTVIYATSNRRHMIKDTFSARSGDELHRNDTIQEQVSLSERFGLCVTFSAPNQDLYLRIVTELCRKEGIDLPEGELKVMAESYALRKSGRSARAARQFVDSLIIRYQK